MDFDICLGAGALPVSACSSAQVKGSALSHAAPLSSLIWLRLLLAAPVRRSSSSNSSESKSLKTKSWQFRIYGTPHTHTAARKGLNQDPTVNASLRISPLVLGCFALPSPLLIRPGPHPDASSHHHPPNTISTWAQRKWMRRRDWRACPRPRRRGRHERRRSRSSGSV